MIRPINFLTIFLFCLAVVVFSLQNTDPVTIKIFKGIDLQAPLCIELIVTMGLGAFLAWLFSVWVKFQRLMESRKLSRELREKETKIKQLEKDLEQYKSETADKKQQLLPSSESLT